MRYKKKAFLGCDKTIASFDFLTHAGSLALVDSDGTSEIQKFHVIEKDDLARYR